MKMLRLHFLIRSVVLVGAVGIAHTCFSASATTAGAHVTLTDNGKSWTLENSIVKATISKENGFLTSLVYNGFDTGSRGVWEHTPQGAPQVTNSVTIDPANNKGERAEVSIKGVGRGTFTFTAGAPGGGTTCDIELRYSLGRGDHGIYTYSIFSHPASYPATGTGAEDRFIDYLDRSFDWITVDRDRNMLEARPIDWGTGVVVHAKEQRIMDKGIYKNSVEHKYSYSGEQYHTPAYGWSSTQTHYGVWFINPTVEYLSGGASRLDLDAHFGADNNPPPIILDYWHSGHYASGTRANISAGEEWTKVIGPIFVYVNHLEHPKAASVAALDKLKATEGNPRVPASWYENANALWEDALAQAKKENSKWPYDWVKGVDYPPLAERGTVSGRIVLNDPMAPKGSSTKLQHLTVILSCPDEPLRELPPMRMASGVVARSADKGMGARVFGPRTTGGAGSWIHEARFYQFIADGSKDGKFTISKIRPGKYTLHAYADGVLGEFEKTYVTVEPGRKVDLGKLEWKPVRFGKQLWEIGFPDRSAREFLKGDGDNSWLWGWNLRYALLFPNDLTFTVGKDDPSKSWFFEEVPHATDLSFVNAEAKDPANQRFGWVKAESLQQYPQTDQVGPWRLGHKCTVAAPSMIPRKPGERIKTDRRDSEKLAILHRSGDLTPVWVPDTTHEALRDLVRARVDASMHLMRARQQLLAFLLRHGRSYPTGKHWTQRHRSWLAGQTFQEYAHGIVFQDYLDTVWTAQQRRDALIERISAMVGSWSLGPLVQALRGLRGIDMISAATFIASTGDLSRFESPRLLMGYLGLVPSEHSSGGTIRRGGITKTGNREARRMLIEAAWSYQYPARVAKEKAEILVRLPKNVRDIAWKAQTRLCTRYRSMVARGKKPTVVVAAIARELAGFIWAIGQEMRSLAS